MAAKAQTDSLMEENPLIMDNFLYMIGFTIFWTIFYFILKKLILKKYPSENSSRFLSLIYGLSSVIMCGLSVCPVFKINEKSIKSLKTLTLSSSIGYYLFDFGYALLTDQETVLTLLQHLFKGYTLSVYVFRETAKNVIICALGASEITTPLLQIRWFAKQYFGPGHLYFTIAEILFCLTYIIIRAFGFSYYVVKFSMDNKIAGFDKTILAIGHILGIIFTVNIIRYVIRKYKIKKEDPGKGLAPLNDEKI